MDSESYFEDVYRISKIDDPDVELCKIKFAVKQIRSVSDDLFVTEVRITYDGHSSLISVFDFSVFKGKQKSLLITDFILQPFSRGCHLSIFILNKVYGYLATEIKISQPRICGSLVERDSCVSRDRMWQKAIGLDVGHPCAEFTVDSNGYGKFNGIFVDVGVSWRQSIICDKM